MIPNFLIVGAAKSGTTAVYNYLKQHSQVFMTPTKETNFFAFEGKKLEFVGMPQNASSLSYQKEIITEKNSYDRQFKQVLTEKAIGESCPSYLYIPQAAERISFYNPEMKIIAILRNPIERAYSSFLHHLRERQESATDFIHAIEIEPERVDKNWWWGFHYTKVGLYYEQIDRYYRLFGREKVRVYLYESFAANTQEVMSDICDFIEVDNHLFDLTKKHNVSRIAKNPFLDEVIKNENIFKSVYRNILPFPSLRRRLTKKISSINSLDKPTLSREIKENLLPLFHQDILKLQDLIAKDLSTWLV